MYPYDEEQDKEPTGLGPIPPELLAIVQADAEEKAKAQEASDATVLEQLKGADADSKANARANLLMQGFGNATAHFLGQPGQRMQMPKVDDNVRAFLVSKAQRKAPSKLETLAQLARFMPRAQGAVKPTLEPTKDYLDRGAALKRKVVWQPGEAPKDFAKRVEDQESAEASVGRGAEKDSRDSAKQSAATAVELRKEFNNRQAVKDMEVAATSYEKVKTTSETGAGDISLIFAYMKMLDPGSTVREGEFATAAQAGSIPQTVVATYNKAVNGEKLSADVRAMFKSEAKRVYDAQRSRFGKVMTYYTDLANGLGIDPKYVVQDLAADDSPPPAKPTAPGAARPGDVYLPKR